MSKLEWNRPQDQVFETGVDRGVIYVEEGPVVAWNGLTSVEDSGETEAKEFYLDGIKFLSWANPRAWAGSISAYTFPDEFAELIGIAEAGEGFYADSQPIGRFCLSYRTMVSAPNYDTNPSYKIHLITDALAVISNHAYETASDSIDPIEFEFEISAVPRRVPGMRPTAHFIIDSRKVSKEKMEQIENILYGTSTNDPYFPSVDELLDLMRYAETVTVVYNGDGTWTATGSSKNIKMLQTPSGGFEIHNAPAEFITEGVYEFFGSSGNVAIYQIVVDTDGIPYYRLGEGFSNVAIDSDGVPYFALGESGPSIKIDSDGVPYYSFT